LFMSFRYSRGVLPVMDLNERSKLLML